MKLTDFGVITSLLLITSVAVLVSEPAYAQVLPDPPGPTVTITSTTANDGETTNSQTISYMATFSEAVTDFVVGDITVTGTANSGTLTASNFAGSGTDYTFDVVTTTDGTVVVSIPANVATVGESEGNSASDTYTVTVDTTGPTIIISSIVVGNDGTTGTQTISYTATFSETVTDFVVGDITVTGTANSGTLTASIFAGSGTDYTFDVVTTTDGTVVVSIPASSATDAVGNQNTVSNTYTVTVDTTLLTVFITSDTAADSTTTSATVSYTATFSEAVTDFVVGDITVTGTASGGSPVASNFAGSDAIYTFDVVTTSGGTVVVSIPLGAATVGESEVNTASNTYTVTVDTPDDNNSDYDIELLKPHFGKSPLTYSQLVSCGFSMDGQCRDVLDYHVQYERTVIQTGTTHDFTLKPYNNFNLRMVQLGFGVEQVGSSINTAEALVEVELVRDYESDVRYTIQSVKTANNLESVIDEVTESNVRLSSEPCKPGADEECLVVHINGVLFRETFYSEPFAINVVDEMRLSSTNYMNEGLELVGESLNPAPEYEIITGKKVQQELEVLQLVRTDKLNDIWTDNNGNTWTKNDVGSWLQLTYTPYLEPQDPAMSVMTRINNNFDALIEHEKVRAIAVFDSSKISG